jgi:hypothetical protein
MFAFRRFDGSGAREEGGRLVVRGSWDDAVCLVSEWYIMRRVILLAFFSRQEAKRAFVYNPSKWYTRVSDCNEKRRGTERAGKERAKQGARREAEGEAEGEKGEGEGFEGGRGGRDTLGERRGKKKKRGERRRRKKEEYRRKKKREGGRKGERRVCVRRRIDVKIWNGEMVVGCE